MALPRELRPPLTVSSINDVTISGPGTAQVTAGSATQRTVTIAALAANTAPVRVGDNASVGAARGLELPPGAAITIFTSGEVSVYAAATQKVSALITSD